MLKTSEEEWYESKVTRHDKFGNLVRIEDALNRVLEEFTVKDRRRLMASFFGHFMTMHQPMKFSGLRFGVVPDTTRYRNVDNGIHQQYFASMKEIAFVELTVVLSRREFQ
ncbi:hypothetical protein Ddye_013173 [Dipteronia dyeriana]|uniref:Uncharacterized protein n=1 Tax=Dipteronia dyeriana TaxID=168575 RepID=A0AAD9X5Y3_9ROSI|nr:hypothetical protein Ddye_013173 [Dipteronia dyeriana]